MGEKSWFKKVVSFWKEEMVPGSRAAFDELGEAAKSMAPPMKKAGTKIKQYSKKVGEEVKDGVQDAKEMTHELTDRVRKKKEKAPEEKAPEEKAPEEEKGDE